MHRSLKSLSPVALALLAAAIFPQQLSAAHSAEKQERECTMPARYCSHLPNSSSESPSELLLHLAQRQSDRSRENAPENWQVFSPADGGFSILMPGEPTEDIRSGSSIPGAGDLHLFLLFLEGDTVAYGVGYRDFPDTASELSPSRVEELLDKFRDSLVRNDKLQGERRIKLDGYAGREIDIESPQGFVSKVRIYWVRGRFYQLVVGAASRSAFPKEADRYFDSFKLIENRGMESPVKPAQKPGNRTGFNEAKRLYQEGLELYNEGQYQEALEVLQQALAIATRSGDKEGESVILDRIGRTYDRLGEYDRALETYDRALALDRETGDRFGEGVTLDYIGRVYENMGQYEKALQLQEQSLVIFQEIDNPRSEAIILVNLGLLYVKLEQYERSLEFYQQALTINREIGERQGEGVTLDYMGVAYGNLGQHQKGLESHQQALLIFQELGNRRSQAIALSNMGTIYSQLNQNKLAAEFFREALDIFQEVGDRESIKSTQRLLQNLPQEE